MTAKPWDPCETPALAFCHDHWCRPRKHNHTNPQEQTECLLQLLAELKAISATRREGSPRP